MFGKAVGFSTISDLLTDKQKWAGTTKDTNIKVVGRFICGFLMYARIKLASQIKCWLKRPRFRDMDKEFTYSSGWLYKFKRRHNISQFIAHEDELNFKKISNMDETGLFYRLQSNATLATVSFRRKR